jgi:hypothetical protein
MASKSELELQGMLLSTGLVQPIRVETEVGRLSALCRMVPGREPEWLKAVEQLLQAATAQGIVLHICKQFVLKSDQMVAGWYVAIEEKSVRRQKAAIDVLGPVLASLTPELGSEPTVRVPVAQIARPVPQETPLEEPLPEEEEEEAVPDTADLRERRRAYQAKTTAPPRAPAPAADLPTMDPAAAGKRIVQRGMAVDSKGKSRQVIIEEMPLPGVFSDDMNKPNEKGRGANRVG